MIPTFPKFTKLSLNHRSHINSLNRQNPPSSDFEFTSLWSWDTSNSVQISSLNHNLVIQLNDYLNDRPFFSFIGSNQLQSTILTLLEYINQNHHHPNEIYLIPEYQCPTSQSNLFSLTQDKDNFDYIYHCPKLIAMRGNKLYTKRKQLNKFTRQFSYTSIIISLTDTSIHKHINNIFKSWKITRAKSDSETTKERLALAKLLDHADEFPNCQVLFILHKHEPIGFSIFENLHNNYAMHPFQKALTHYPGIFELLNHELAKYLLTKHCTFINTYQDLGIPSLRAAKRKYDPTFIKKFTITPASIH